MTKNEILAKVAEIKKAKTAMAEAAEITNADQTVANIKTPVTNAPIKPAEGAPTDVKATPTEKQVEKAVDNAMDPIVPADKDGVSKNGGEDEALMSEEGLEKAKAKEDHKMKDAINVATRKVEEVESVKEELLAQLKEARENEESLNKKINEIQELCEATLKTQAEDLAKSHAQEFQRILEKIGQKASIIENRLTKEIENNKKLYEASSRYYANSAKLNKILLEAVKNAQPKKTLTRYTTFARKIAEANN